jgi:hypothetical protein
LIRGSSDSKGIRRAGSRRLAPHIDLDHLILMERRPQAGELAINTTIPAGATAALKRLRGFYGGSERDMLPLGLPQKLDPRVKLNTV